MDGISRFWFDAQVNAQDLSSTYLPAWIAASEANTKGIMCSYNELNGIPMCANEHLLNDVLRKNLSFGGHIVSDCGAINNIQLTQKYKNDTPEQAAADALSAGTDLNCGNGYKFLNSSIAQGLTTWDNVDIGLSRTLLTRFELGMFDPVDDNPWSALTLDQVGSDAHIALAKKTALESMVLLKNSHQRLPLSRSKIKNIGILGNSANDSLVLLGNYHGDPAFGKVVTPLEAVTTLYGENNVFFDRGVWVTGEGNFYCCCC